MKIKKIPVYYRYLKEYLRYRDLQSVRDAVRYILFHKGSKKNRILRCRLGKIHARKNTNDFQFANFYYEWNVKRFIVHHHPAYHYFFDIGAGIGEYGMLMGQKGKKVYLFEPHPGSYKLISMNLHSNKPVNMEAFNFGLGKENIQTSFLLHPVNTGASHFIRPGRPIPQGYDVRKLEVRTLDSIAGDWDFDFSKPVLMKIDVEGMEADVLKGAKEFIRKCRNIMIVVEDKHSGRQAVVKALAEAGNFDTARIDNLNLYAIKNQNQTII